MKNCILSLFTFICLAISPDNSFAQATSAEAFLDSAVVLSEKGDSTGTAEALTKSTAALENEAKAGPIRVYESHSNKFHKDLPRNYTVAGINDYVNLIAERTPEDELDSVGTDFINAFHFQGEPSKVHGIPFKFRIFEVSTKLVTFTTTI